MPTNKISFRIGYRKIELSEDNRGDVDEYQLSPTAPLIYCEKNDFLTSEDIVKASCNKIKNSEIYQININITNSAFEKINFLCNHRKIPRLILFIKGVPFYTISLNGPFKTNDIQMVVSSDKNEVDLLVQNLNCS